jgi:hypothetical protein
VLMNFPNSEVCLIGEWSIKVQLTLNMIFGMYNI